MPLQCIISLSTTFVSYNNYNKKIYAIAGMVAWLYAPFFFANEVPFILCQTNSKLKKSFIIICIYRRDCFSQTFQGEFCDNLILRNLKITSFENFNIVLVINNVVYPNQQI
jgi:hypothetical protein